MSSIQQVDSAPDYIMKFIHGNIQQLEKIYGEGIAMFEKGLLAFQCSEKENKMDVQFMNDESMLQVIQKESWEQLKKSIPESKKLFYIKDGFFPSVSGGLKCPTIQLVPQTFEKLSACPSSAVFLTALPMWKSLTSNNAASKSFVTTPL